MIRPLLVKPAINKIGAQAMSLTANYATSSLVKSLSTTLAH
jgi:hypothetical protein